MNIHLCSEQTNRKYTTYLLRISLIFFMSESLIRILANILNYGVKVSNYTSDFFRFLAKFTFTRYLCVYYSSRIISWDCYYLFDYFSINQLK